MASQSYVGKGNVYLGKPGVVKSTDVVAQNFYDPFSSLHILA